MLENFPLIRMDHKFIGYLNIHSNLIHKDMIDPKRKDLLDVFLIKIKHNAKNISKAWSQQ